MKNKPFYVIFELSSYPFLARYTYLDGLLAYCAVQEAGGDMSVKDDLPLKRHESGVFHASLWFNCSVDYMLFYSTTSKIIKTPIDRDYSDVTKIYDRPLAKQVFIKGQGKYKTHQLVCNPALASKIIFFGCGNIEEVEKLLKKHIKYVGRKRSLGYGQVFKIEVKEIEKDVSLVFEGSPMRPLPVDYFDLEAPIVLSPIVSPYWDKRNCQPCYMPGMRIECPEELKKFVGLE